VTTKEYPVRLNFVDKQRMISSFSRNFRVLVLTIAVLGVAACGSDGLDDLREYVKKEHADRKPRVEPLPEIKIPPTFTYSVQDKADPFASGNLSPKSAQNKAKKSLPLYLATRRKGPLEAYPLDALKMVGTLQRKKEVWVVIQAPDGSMHRAKQGDFLGKNYGMITQITDDKVSLMEKIQNAVGDWVDRQAAISITE